MSLFRIPRCFEISDLQIGVQTLVAAFVFANVAACSAPAPTDIAEVPADPQSETTESASHSSGTIADNGRILYEARCASCHENPVDRTPARSVIEKNPPKFILEAMKGVMAPMSTGLSEDEMRSIAIYLSTTDPLSPHAIWGPSSATMPMDGPMCEGPVPPVNLAAPGQWMGWSPEKDNARFQKAPGLKAADVPRLKVKWAFKYPGSKNGQATVVGDRLFTTSMTGAVYALNARTGCVYWRHDADAATRSSVSLKAMPAGSRAKTALFYSDWTQSAAVIDADTGELIWKTKIEDNTGVQLTGAPTLWKDTLLVPISTGNEAFAAYDAYVCCKFIGSLVALNANTGEILWKRYTTDEKNAVYRKTAKGQDMYGPAGGSIWSAPTIDPERGLIYVATSNSHTDKFHDGANSIMAIDLKTGAVVWKNQILPDDNYINGCPKAANCPEKVGPDFAFGSSPILHTGRDGRQLLLAGQKSGIIWALDPADGGKIVWHTQLSQGSELGGIEFGPAADADKVYVAVSDVIAPAETAKPGLTALYVKDGSIAWSAPSPARPCRWENVFCSPAMSQAVTAIPGVVFAGAMNGYFRAYDTATGKVVWEFDTGGTPIKTVAGKETYGGVMDASGPTVAGGMVYVHSGYGGRQGAERWGDNVSADGNLLVAFSVDGK
jgi:polyvinyl alcohol dehydrogenase (cytochrome)